MKSNLEYDVIFITGEPYFDHPLCGVAILKRLLEKYGYVVGVIENPKNSDDITKLGQPKLFFGVSSGSIDSMVRNYTPLKKPRILDEHKKHYSVKISSRNSSKNSRLLKKDLEVYNQNFVPDRAIIVYCNWIREKFKESKIVIGGTESSLRRFTHYDYWDNKLRRPIIFDSRADLLSYGSGEKQTLEIARRIKDNESLFGIEGTCIISKNLEDDLKTDNNIDKIKLDEFIELPSFEDVSNSKEKFCDMQLMFSNNKNMFQKIDTRCVVQFKIPKYFSNDLDEYYELPFTRDVPKELRGFQFSVVTHRGCFGGCNFCSVKLTQGEKIVSRSIDSILKELKQIVKHPQFRGNIDDLGGPSTNMYGMDCDSRYVCEKNCMTCSVLKSSDKYLELLKKAREIKGIEKINIRSGIRYELLDDTLIKEIGEHHIADTLRIAPEHVKKDVLDLMNKNIGDLPKFISKFEKICPKKKLSFYFMTAHPGSKIDDAKDLGKFIDNLENAESVQIFTPTPMSVSTCMYYTGLEPKSKKQIHIPYSYSEKKQQKNVVMDKFKKN
jgi:uncharacterized radical SAM protein YgiQ